MDSLVKPQAIEIRIGDVDLPTKLSAIGAALAAVQMGHRDQIGSRTWAALHRAQNDIGEAILHVNDRRLTSHDALL